MKRKVEGFPAVIGSTRDLGREGHGGEYAGGSPWARNGIFIQGLSTKASKESFPGIVPGSRPAIENKGMKTIHEFAEWGSPVCGICVLLREGHDRLMKKLAEA